MQHAFGIVLFVVVGASVIVALATLAGSRRAYDEIGKGGLFEEDPKARPWQDSHGGVANVRDEEIRQMLEARNARRIRRGEEPSDIDAELAELTRPRIDPALLAEIRDLVEARSARRVRRGEAPLDIEAEVARKLLEFG
jgi:hypothetical protein